MLKISSLLFILFLIAPTIPSIYAADNATKITGTILPSNSDTSGPKDILVTLNVLEGVSSVRETSVNTNAQGAFEFEINPIPNRIYFISTQYKGATYSSRRNYNDFEKPIEITVFDSTKDISVLEVQNHSIIVTGAVPEEGFIEILERVSIVNSSNQTFIADQADGTPSMPNFLRFALPKGAYNLDVRSNLIGGQVLEVDRGFALTTPITPTIESPHQIEFVYRVNYSEQNISLSRILRFGAKSFRLVVPTNVGTPRASQLKDLGATELNGKLLRLLEATDIEPASELEINLSDLKLPSLITKISNSLNSWYTLLIVPVILALCLIYLLVYLISRNRKPSSIESDISIDKQLSDLSHAFEAGIISRGKYQARRKRIQSQYTLKKIQEQMERLQDNAP
tara:strand:- start:14669 stop:15859 length:1191 start_codon:yes stop_codon:yes gene_type:complete